MYKIILLKSLFLKVYHNHSGFRLFQNAVLVVQNATKMALDTVIQLIVWQPISLTHQVLLASVSAHLKDVLTSLCFISTRDYNCTFIFEDSLKYV